MRRTSTSRVLGAVGLAVSAMMVLAAPAAAQYGDDPSVRERVGNTTPERVVAPAPVVFTSDPVFEPGTDVEVFLVRAVQGAEPTEVAPAVIVATNGSVTATFTVPAGTPPGIYFVYATGEGENGETLRVVSILIVLANPPAISAALPPAAGGGDAGPGSAPAAPGVAGTGESGSAGDAVAAGDGGGGPATTPSAGSVSTPAEIQAIQYPADVEKVLFEEAVASDGPITLDADGLLLAGGLGGVGGDAATGGDTAPGPVAAALVAGVFVAGGLFALRRRQQHAS